MTRPAPFQTANASPSIRDVSDSNATPSTGYCPASSWSRSARPSSSYATSLARSSTRTGCRAMDCAIPNMKPCSLISTFRWRCASKSLGTNWATRCSLSTTLAQKRNSARKRSAMRWAHSWPGFSLKNTAKSYASSRAKTSPHDASSRQSQDKNMNGACRHLFTNAYKCNHSAGPLNRPADFFAAHQRMKT